MPQPGDPPHKERVGPYLPCCVPPPHPPQLISSVDPKFLTLTKVDEQIYGEFRKAFGGLRVDVLDPEDLKSEPAKEKWRPFCLQFEGVVEDFNYGTLLRLDCRGGYSPENTIFGTETPSGGLLGTIVPPLYPRARLGTPIPHLYPWGSWVLLPPVLYLWAQLGTSIPHRYP